MIIAIPKHLFDANMISNSIFIVKTINVRGPTLARLAMVLVRLSIGGTPALRVQCPSFSKSNTGARCSARSYWLAAGRPIRGDWPF